MDSRVSYLEYSASDDILVKRLLERGETSGR